MEAPKKNSFFSIGKVTFWISLFCLLSISISSYKLIPFWSFWGLDLHNLHTFQNCQFRLNPYIVSGVNCGDVGARDMYYPPLLYWSFFWLKGLSLKTSLWIWSFTSVGFMLCAYYIWCKLMKHNPMRVDSLLFWFLLLLQYPLVFTLERSNTDAAVVIMWSLGSFFLLKNKFLYSGVAFSFLAIFKLYPGIPLLLVIIGLISSHWGSFKQNNKNLFNFFLGGLIPPTIQLITLQEQTILYFSKVLPTFASQISGFGAYSHSLKPLDQLLPHTSLILKILILGLWAFATLRSYKTDPILLLSGYLSISTFFANTTYDYNLVTVYPFLLILFIRANSLFTYIWTFLGVLVFLGHRGLWPIIESYISLSPPYLRVVVGVSWIILSGLFIGISPSSKLCLTTPQPEEPHQSHSK